MRATQPLGDEEMCFSPTSKFHYSRGQLLVAEFIKTTGHSPTIHSHKSQYFRMKTLFQSQLFRYNLCLSHYSFLPDMPGVYFNKHMRVSLTLICSRSVWPIDALSCV